MIINTDRDQTNTTELKIISTRVFNGIRSPDDEGDNVFFTKGSLLFPCGGHTALEVTILIPPSLLKEKEKKSNLHSCFLHMLLM